MTFRSIGTLAGDVLRKSERTAQRRALKFAASRPGEESEGSPALLVDAPAPSGSNEVTRASGDQHASDSHEGVTARTVATPPRGELKLIRKVPPVSGRRPRAQQFAASGLPPAPALGLRLITVNGERVHAAKPSASA